jgi:hypothetical protein
MWVVAPPNQTNKVGDPVSVQVSANDVDRFTATGLPAGLSINNSGLISGTATTAGSFNVQLTAFDSTVASTSVSFTWTVSQSSTTTTLTSSANPAVSGQSITFTATVTGGMVKVSTLGGTVTFKDGTTVLGTGTLVNGVATYTTSSLAVRTHSITAVYGGNSNFLGSTSTALSQPVNQASTTTAISSSANPSVSGQSVTFTATVSAVLPGSGKPSGTVTFMDGTTALGTGTLSNGVATFKTSSLTVKTHSITAVYGGDTNFKTSTSSALSQVVNKASTQVALTASPTTINAGQSVTFTATVTAVTPGGGTPTGTVTFMDGNTVLGTAPVNSSGVATFTTTKLSKGKHTITAVYSGDSSFNSLTSTGLVETVN